MKKIHIIALAFTLFITLSHSAGYTEEGGACFIDTLEIPQFSFVTVGLAVVGFGIGMAYMYSRFREDPAIGTWSKDEASNLVITTVLFGGIIAFVTGSCSLAQSYSHGNPFEVSINYLDNLATYNGLNVLNTLTRQSISDQSMATKYLYMGAVPFYGEGAARSAGLRALSAQKELVIDIYLPILASLNAQKFIMQGIEWVSLSILLPFAFAMRVVPFTREYGNMLIAIFITMYVIVPTTYAMSAKTFDSIVKQDSLSCVNCNIYKFGTYGLDGARGNDAKTTVFYKIGSTLPQAIFIPNLVLVIAITAVMSISKALRAIAV